MTARLAPLLLLVLVVCSAAARAESEDTPAADVRLAADHLRNDHPNLFHDLSPAAFDAAVDDLASRAPSIGEDELLVGLMRLAALPGVRDGHTGIFPLDPENSRMLHSYPIHVYEFADGTYVIGQADGGSDLLRARLIAVNGRPLDEVEALVRPLVPHDNESTLRLRLTMYLLTAEVLHGLGVAPNAGPLPFTFERDGRRFDATLTPISVPAYNAAIGDLGHPLIGQAITGRVPAYVARRKQDQWTTRLAARRVFYIGYNETTRGTWTLSRRTLKAAKPKRLRAVIVDLRNNGGGDNRTYGDLLSVLRRLSKTKRIVVILSRVTFSAAENFAVDVEKSAHPVFVGEPSGGSPNLYGDAVPTLLPASGLQLRIATIYWQKSTADDPRLAIDPQVPVSLSSSDFFAGRDPVLAAALKNALG
jgi:hypothetical protein